MVTKYEWEQLGRAAYDARFEKYKIPWEEQPKEIKQVWINVAKAVMKASI